MYHVMRPDLLTCVYARATERTLTHMCIAEQCVFVSARKSRVRSYDHDIYHVLYAACDWCHMIHTCVSRESHVFRLPMAQCLMSSRVNQMTRVQLARVAHMIYPVLHQYCCKKIKTFLMTCGSTHMTSQISAC